MYTSQTEKSFQWAIILQRSSAYFGPTTVNCLLSYSLTVCLHPKSINWVSGIDESKWYEQYYSSTDKDSDQEHRATFARLGDFIHRSHENSNTTQIPVITSVTDFKIRDETSGPKLDNVALETCQTYLETVADSGGAQLTLEILIFVASTAGSPSIANRRQVRVTYF